MNQGFSIAKVLSLGELSMLLESAADQVALSFQNNIDEAVERSRALVTYWHDLGYKRQEALLRSVGCF